MVLAVIALLRATGCLSFQFHFKRFSITRRMTTRNRGLSFMSQGRKGSTDGWDGNDTWYECIEDDVGGLLDYPRVAFQAAVPLLAGLDAAEAGFHDPRLLRLTKLQGNSMPHQAKEDRPDGISRATWSPANASDLMVRQGPDYPSTGLKEASMPAMYRCTGCDTVKAGCMIKDPLPRLGPLPAGGQGWHKGLGIPRAVIFNCQFPLEEGPKMFGEHPADDAGTSVIVQFVATDEVIRVAGLEAKAKESGRDGPSAADEPIIPAVRLLRDLFARGTVELPDGQKPGFHASGAMKCIGMVEDLEDVELPRLLKPPCVRNNGKPVLLTNFGSMNRDESGEWMCIDFDIRGMTWLTRSLLCKLRHRFREVSVHAAFVIQGTKDDELPEVVLGSLRIHGMDVDRAAWINDPRAPPGSQPPEVV